VKIEVDAVDADGKTISDNNYSVEVTGPEQVKPEVERKGNKIVISFKTHLYQGQFVAKVNYNGRPIQRSPFEINLAGRAFENQVEEVVKLEALPTTREIQFVVQGRDSKGGKVTASQVTARFDKGPQAPKSIKIIDKGTSELQVSLEVAKPGEYEISILKNGEQIEDSPFYPEIPAEAFKQP